MSYFSDLGLAEPILHALASKGYTDPTPIQRQAIPALLEGRDLLGIAQTGTGKTAAFALPSLHRLAADPKPRMPASCRMLVLSPTRELAAQIAENIAAYAKNLRLTVDCVFGGVPVGKQSRRLVPGCDILVATPGRLLDLIDQRALTLGRVEIFVLDEADQMMDLGFIHALKRVANMLPKQRQSLFFSATMPKAIADLGKQFINNPVRVEVAPQATTAERVEQFVTFVNQAEKQALLTIRLKTLIADGKLDRALIFTRTKHGADRVVRHLNAATVNARAIHGNKTQAQRTAALDAFRQGSCPVLVATDIAARGIDVSGVSHVFNYELPNVSEQYVHRIGRTARAGADGEAISFCAPDEKPYLRDIEKLTGIQLMPLPLPDDFQKEAARLPAPTRKPDEAAQDARREARDARGRGGPQRDGGRGRDGGRDGARDGGRDGARGNGGGNRGPAHNSHGGKAQGRDGRPRDASPVQGSSFQDRGPVANPARAELSAKPAGGGDRRPQRSADGHAGAGAGAHAGEGGEQRRFRPRGPNAVGQHRNKVRRIV